MNRQTDRVDQETKDTVAGKRKHKIQKILLIIGLTIIVLLLIAVLVLCVMIIQGKNKVKSDNTEVQNVISVVNNTVADTQDEPYDYEEYGQNYVYYNGKKYKYNDNISTILFAGIDRRSSDNTTDMIYTAGQADCVMVLAIDRLSGDYKLIAVSRDTMVDVDVFNRNGDYVDVEKQQLCLAYGYCDGKEKSCENLKRSVSRILFGIPINSYVAVDLDVISILNDKVGGVTVEIPEDLTKFDPTMTKGRKLTLDNKQAEVFVRARDIYGDEYQNDLRMARQKVYIKGFITKALDLTKQDITVPIQMYESVSDYLVTDIDVSMISYYTCLFLKNDFSADKNMVKVPGQAVGGEKYAEYYVDTDELLDMVIDIFFVEIK